MLTGSYTAIYTRDSLSSLTFAPNDLLYMGGFDLKTYDSGFTASANLSILVKETQPIFTRMFFPQTKMDSMMNFEFSSIPPSPKFVLFAFSTVGADWCLKEMK